MNKPTEWYILSDDDHHELESQVAPPPPSPITTSRHHPQTQAKIDAANQAYFDKLREMNVMDGDRLVRVRKTLAARYGAK